MNASNCLLIPRARLVCWITRLVVPLSEISAENSHWTVSQSSSNDMSTPN